MKNTMEKAFLFLALSLIFAGVSFAQRVGDTVQVNGEPWTVRTFSGNTMSLEKVVAQADNPVNWVAVADSTFGTSQINGVAFGNNT